MFFLQTLSPYLLLGFDGRARVRRRRRELLVEVLERQAARGEDGERAGGHGCCWVEEEGDGGRREELDRWRRRSE